MGSRIAILVGLAVVVGFAVWAALPRRDAAAARPMVAAADPPAAAPTVTNTDAAINACVAAQREVASRRAQRGGPAPAGQPSDAAVVARACAPLYKDAGCRDALVNFDRPAPEARTSTIFQVCARAYCDQLPAPKPSACAQPPSEPSQMAAAWGELRQAILRHDVGADAAARVANALR